MSLFSKEPADASYFQFRDNTWQNYNLLKIWNPFAPAEELKDKWSVMYDQFRQLYRLAKHYVDTAGDVPTLKACMDDAKKKVDEYQHEICYLNYKNEVDSIIETYKKQRESLYGTFCSWGDEKECLDIFSVLYQRVAVAYKHIGNFRYDNIDEDELLKAYRDIAFYYASFLLAMMDYKSANGDPLSYNFRKECLEDCKRVTGQFRNSAKDHRYMILHGCADFELGELWKEFEEMNPDLNPQYIQCQITSCRNSASNGLNAMRDEKYLRSAIDGIEGFDAFDLLECKNLYAAFLNLFSIYIYSNHNYMAAYSLCRTLLDNLKYQTGYTDRVKSIMNGVEGELNKFVRKSNGEWLYSG